VSAGRKEDLDLMTLSRYGTKQHVEIHVPVSDVGEKDLVVHKIF